MKKITFALAGLVTSLSVASETIEVDYASFYSHVKKLDNEETNALRFAFGFAHIQQNRLCQLGDASIITEKQQIDLKVENASRFTVPIDKILKMAKAKVRIDILEQANQCDMSVQLETLPTLNKIQYSAQELKQIFTQYQAFFDNIGGIFSFMMPSVQGLIVQLEKSHKVTDNLSHLINEQGHLELSEDWIEQGNTLTLTKKPLRITARVEK